VLLLESYQAASTLHPFDMFGLGEAAWSDQHQSPGEEVRFLKLSLFAREKNRRKFQGEGTFDVSVES
jgi:hypothetical protein